MKVARDAGLKKLEAAGALWKCPTGPRHKAEVGRKTEKTEAPASHRKRARGKSKRNPRQQEVRTMTTTKTRSRGRASRQQMPADAIDVTDEDNEGN